MANNRSASSALLLTAVFLFAAASNPLAHGQVLTLPPSRPIGGSLCCTRTGNCPGGQAIPGVTVNVTCNINIPGGGGSVVVGRGTTNVNGTFNITVPGALSNLRPSPCVATVQLPLTVSSSVVCPILNTTGILVSTARIFGPIASALGVLLDEATFVGFVNVKTT